MTETQTHTGTAGHGIAGKVVAITGAGRGIGAATARHLAARGARVMLGSRAERDLAATADAITAIGGTAAYRCTDVTQPGDLRALVDLAVHRFGRLDVLTSIAGVAITAPLEPGQLEDWIAMPAEAVAETIAFAIARPAAVDIGEIIVRPTIQP